MDTKSTSIIGVVILAVLTGGFVLWYMSEHPAPYVKPSEATAPGSSGTVSSKNLDEIGTYYEVRASYPGSTPLKGTAGATADAQAVEVMKQFEVNTITAFKEQGNFANLSHDDVQMMGLDQRRESVEIKYEAKTGSKTISYLYTIYQDTLGAHPNTYFRTFTFNNKTGEGMDIADFFVPGTDYLKILSTAARKKLPSALAAREGVSANDVDVGYMNRGTTPDADNFQNWYIEGNALVLVFPPYQVAPYSAGTQLVTIPFSEMGVAVSSLYR